jgi:multisubunit Na+/H+ antiporter MnhB subunit
MLDAVNIATALLILGLATWTIIAREAFTAAIGFIAYGLLLMLAWVQLHGADVALTEAAIGGGLTGILLISAAARLRGNETADSAVLPDVFLLRCAAAVSITVSLALVVCVLALPDNAPTLAHEVAHNIGDTGVGNPITAVLLAFRAMDTMLEAIVLLFALIGIWSLASDDCWGGRPEFLQQSDPNGILAYAARILVPIGIIIGIYIFWIGADDPGGKFQGATILAAMWLLVIMSGLADTPSISRGWLRIGLVIGPLVFIAIGFVGVLVTGYFFGYPEGIAKAFIIAIELALMPSLTLVLALLLLGAPQRESQP